jgi:hypothetical protein
MNQFAKCLENSVGYVETWRRKRNNLSGFSSSLTDLWYKFWGKLFMMINIDINPTLSIKGQW